jgi:hypothetical protein
MELMVEGIAKRIEQAGKDVRASDHQALAAAREGFAYATQKVNGVVATALTARAQRKWMGIAAGTGTMLGMILIAIFPGAIARSMVRTAAGHSADEGERCRDQGLLDAFVEVE